MGDEERGQVLEVGGSEVKVTRSLRNIQQGYMLNTRPKLCKSRVTHTALIAQVVGYRGMSRSVKCLLFKCEFGSQQHLRKKLCMVLHISHLSDAEVEKGGALGLADHIA